MYFRAEGSSSRRMLFGGGVGRGRGFAPGFENVDAVEPAEAMLAQALENRARNTMV